MKRYFVVRLSTGRGYNNCINFSNKASTGIYAARACMFMRRERSHMRKRDRGGEKSKHFHLKFVGSECLGENVNMGTWGSSASLSVWFCLGALRLIHSTNQPPDPGTCARITAGHTPSEEYVIISRSDECVAVSGDARHSRSTADDGEELPEL